MKNVLQKLLLLVLVVASYTDSWAHEVAPQNGVVDFRNEDFKEVALVSLAGEWLFFWNQLLEPQQTDSLLQKADRVAVPTSWHANDSYPLLGVGTYRMDLFFSGNQSNLALYFPVVHSAFNIWINGRLVHENRKVGVGEFNYQPKLQSVLVSLPDFGKHVTIVIQVANFSYFSSGIVRAPILQKTPVLSKYVSTKNGLFNFLIGSFVAMFLYQLILFIHSKNERSYLWLSLICLCVALRSALTSGGSFLLPELFPGILADRWRELEFLAVYSTVAFLPLYIYDLFPKHAPKWPLKFFGGISLFLCSLVLFFKQPVYGQFLHVYDVALVLVFVYMLYGTVKAFQWKNKESKLILVGQLLAFPLIAVEVLQIANLIDLHFSYSFFVEFALLIFLFFQILLLVRRYALSKESLNKLNKQLEFIVDERTNELEKSNQIKDRLLSIISHDIKSPLNSLASLLQLFQKKHVTQTEFTQMANNLESEFSKTSLMVENLLSWSASQLKGVHVKKVRFDLTEMLDHLLDQLQPYATRKNLVVSHNLSGSVFIQTDYNILLTTLRNLVANAIKFSYTNGKIVIQVNSIIDCLSIEVVDNGVGMDADTLSMLTAQKNIGSRPGTSDEKGTGIGLMLCEEYLSKIGGVLTIDSKPGEGSTFQLVIPIDTVEDTVDEKVVV